MSANGRAASNVIELHAADRRERKVVAAARVVSIDYRSIVENAVAGLVHNTPDARREVYSQARQTVRRHLQLMRLPEPIVEVEKLSLDLTIKKIERQWRSWQAAEQAIPDIAGEPTAKPAAVANSVASLSQALAALAQALGLLTASLGLRPLISLFWMMLWPVRAILRLIRSSIGLAVALPVAVVAIFAVYFVDNNTAYKSLVDGPAGRWISHLDIVPHAPPPRTRSKAADQVRTGTQASARLDAPPGPAATSARPAVVEMPTRPVVPDAPVQSATELPQRPAPVESEPYRGPTRVRPIRAEFTGTIATAAAPATDFEAAPVGPAKPSNPCDAKPVLADRISCAITNWAGSDQAPRTKSGNSGRPRWLPGFAVINDVAGTRSASATPFDPPTATAPTAAFEVAALPGPALSGPPPGQAAAIASPAPASSTAAPIARPANAKLAALIDSGRKWSNKGDLEHAVRDFSEAIRVDPKYPDSYAERGQALFKMGETERAIADYSAALAHDPQFGAALRSRGMAYLYRGSPDLALADLSRAIGLVESDPSLLAPIELFYARRSRAAIYSSKQQYDLEIGDCTALIEAQANDRMVAEVLKQNYGDVGAANVIAAIYRQRATAYIRRSNWELAVADLSAAIPLSADRGYAALMDRSKLHEGLGQRDEAIADLQSALAVRPGSEEVRLALRRLGAAPKLPGRPI